MKIHIATDDGEVLETIDEVGDLDNHLEAMYLIDQIRQAQKVDLAREKESKHA